MKNSTNRLRLAVFDCDGTLVDSLQMITTAMEEAFGQCSLKPPPRDAVRRIIGLPLETAIQSLVQEQHLDRVMDLSDAYKGAFRGLRTAGHDGESLYPGTREILADLQSRDWLLGVATGKSRVGLDHVLAHHGLETHFTTLQTADHGPGKPHPDMLHRAMKETGTDPQDLIMVGDTTFDMEMARNAGVFAVGVAWGYHSIEDLHQGGADAVIHKFEELHDVIENRHP